MTAAEVDHPEGHPIVPEKRSPPQGDADVPPAAAQEIRPVRRRIEQRREGSRRGASIAGTPGEILADRPAADRVARVDEGRRERPAARRMREVLAADDRPRLEPRRSLEARRRAQGPELLPLAQLVDEAHEGSCLLRGRRVDRRAGARVSARCPEPGSKQHRRPGAGRENCDEVTEPSLHVSPTPRARKCASFSTGAQTMRGKA